MTNPAMPAAVRHLYLHVPYCAAKCPYCDFNSIAGRDDEHGAYVSALLAEVARLPPGPYATVFIGGGTPTALRPALLDCLLAGVADHIDVTDDYEWTCEANPGSSDETTFRVLADHGVNRVSLGVQSIHDHHLRYLGRVHDAAQAERAISAAREIFPRVSADLIVGLPDQTLAEIALELEVYRRHQLDHASVYHLAIEPGTEFHARHQRGELSMPDQDHAQMVLETVWAQLEALGLAAYETSNFARPGQACRHNLAYWRQADYHAAGAGAVSTVAGQRVTRQPHPARYIAALADNSADNSADISAEHTDSALVWKRETLSREEQLTECWMLGLRLAEGVPTDRLAVLGDSPDRWLPIAERLANDGQLVIESGSLRLTPSGRRVQDAVTVALLP